jgi:hypothetical protein
MNNSLNDEFENQEITSEEDTQLSGLLQQWTITDKNDDISTSVINLLKRRHIVYKYSIWGSAAASVAAILFITFMPVKQVDVVQLNNSARKQYTTTEQKSVETVIKVKTNLGSKKLKNPAQSIAANTAKPAGMPVITAMDKTNVNEIALSAITETPVSTVEPINNKVEVASVAVLNSITETE